MSMYLMPSRTKGHMSHHNSMLLMAIALNWGCYSEKQFWNWRLLGYKATRHVATFVHIATFVQFNKDLDYVFEFMNQIIINKKFQTITIPYITHHIRHAINFLYVSYYSATAPSPVWYKTKVGGPNFGYQIWFCTRLIISNDRHQLMIITYILEQITAYRNDDQHKHIKIILSESI